MNSYSLGPMVLGGSSGFSLTDLQNRSIDPSLDIMRATASGQAFNSMAAILETKAMESFQTGAIGTLLSKVNPLLGLAFPGTNIDGLDVYFVKNDPGGDRMAGSNHLKTSMASGRIMVKGLSVAQGKAAMADVEVHPLYDGTNAFWTTVADQPLPSLTYPISERYTLGPVKINGTLINCNQGWSYDQAASIEKISCQGVIFPDTLYFSEGQPMLTIQGLDAGILATLGLTGNKQGGSATTLYLRKVDANANTLPDASAVHVKITVNANQGLIYPGSWSAGPTTKASGTIMILPTIGTNPILTFATGVAIT